MTPTEEIGYLCDRILELRRELADREAEAAYYRDWALDLADRDEVTCVALRELLGRLEEYLGPYRPPEGPNTTEVRAFMDRARATLPENLTEREESDEQAG